MKFVVGQGGKNMSTRIAILGGPRCGKTTLIQQLYVDMKIMGLDVGFAARTHPAPYKPCLRHAHRAGSPRLYGMSKLRLIIFSFDNAALSHPAPYKPCLRHAHRADRPRPYGMSKLRFNASLHLLPCMHPGR